MNSRSSHLSVALLVAVPLATAPLHAQGMEYAAGTTRYRVSTTTKGTQSTAASNIAFEVGLQEQVTVNLMKHAKDTVMATVTLDSITLKSTGPVPDVTKLVGAQWVSLLSPTGKFYSTKAPTLGTDAQLGTLMDALPRFLPAFRANLVTGAAWADTTSGKVSQQGMDLDRVSISNFKVAGDTTIGGDRALRIERVTTVKAAGSGTMQGTPVLMETSGSSNGAIFLTPKGVYLGSNSTDDVSVKITILAQNAEFNIKQVVQTKVEAIK